MLRIDTGEPVPWSPEHTRAGGLRAVAQAYVGSDAFPDQLFDRGAARRLLDRHFDRGESLLEEVGLLLTLATASRLLSGDLRAVPAEAQPDLSTASSAGRGSPARAVARAEPGPHASP